MKLIFLDFDGVICTPRAFNSQRYIEDMDLRWLDQIASYLISTAIEDSGIEVKIIISSTWRHFGIDICKKILGDNLGKYLHEDWNTLDLWDRSKEIESWLESHEGEFSDYIILDDECFNFNEEQLSRQVKSDTYDGFSLANHIELLYKLKGESIPDNEKLYHDERES